VYSTVAIIIQPQYGYCSICEIAGTVSAYTKLELKLHVTK